MFLFYLIAALWLGWLGYWIAASTQVKPVARSESWQSRVAYSVPLWISAFLLLDRHFGHVLNRHLFPSMPWTLLLGTALTAAGIAFAVWARVVLGANWSAEVTVKEGHELIQTGPYALARHPIYTGLALAVLGTAIAVGEWRALIALILTVGSFWYKLGIEERVMTETFGAAYDNYRRRVRALIPFVV